MAFQTANMLLPDMPSGFDLVQNSGTSGYDSTLLSGATEKVAYLITAPKDGTIDAVGFLTGAVTTGDDIKVSFQDMTTTSDDPDGTIDEYRVVTIADVDDNTWIDVSSTGFMTDTGADGGTKRTVVQGDRFFIVFEFDSYVAGNLNLKNTGMTARSNFNGQDYLTFYNGTIWAPDSDNSPVFSLKYDDGTYAYIPGTIPCSVLNSLTLNTGTTPDEVALIFQMPFACKVKGAWFLGEVDGDISINLYSGAAASTSIMDSGNATVAIDKDNRPSTVQMPYFVLFPNEVELSINTDYYLSYLPTSAASAKIKYMDADAAAILDQMGGGQNFRYSERVNALTWDAATSTRRLFMGLVISALDDGIGGGGAGGLLRNPPLTGGTY